MPASELASFSVFDKVDLAALAKGSERRPWDPHERQLHLGAKLLCGRRAPLARVADALRQWNPARHSELKVLLHSDLPSSPGPANFSRLSSAPNNGAVQSLVSATQKGSTDLQISKEEAKKLPTGVQGGGAMPAPVASFWAGVLSGRARAFSSGGTRAQPPYDHTGTGGPAFRRIQRADAAAGQDSQAVLGVDR